MSKVSAAFPRPPQPMCVPHISLAQRVHGVMDMKAPFEEAVAKHGPTVLRVCRATLGASADADDAWSETFLAALRA